MPRKPQKDMAGLTFGRLSVLHYDEQRTGGWWICRCECGVVKSVRGNYLRTGRTLSCDCLRKERARAANPRLTHGMSKGNRTYRIWMNMKNRCTNPKSIMFHVYGGRGIRFCERWGAFENFLADMGEAPPDRSLDRIDPDGNYEPSNCRWATRIEQANNTRRNVCVEWEGERFTVAQLARRVSMPESAIRRRLASGWSVDRIVSVPVRHVRLYSNEPKRA